MNDFDTLKEAFGNGPRPTDDALALELALQQAKAEKGDVTIMGRILDSIDAITRDKSYIHEALIAFKEKGDPAGSIGDLAKARESTNRQALMLLEKMYDGIKPPQSQRNFLESIDINHIIPHMDSDDVADFLLQLAGMQKHH